MNPLKDDPSLDTLERPDWLRRKKVSELSTTQPPQLIHGMLYKGQKLILMAGSKSFKTWTLMDMAFCVSNGFLWWQMHTTPCPGVYLDFELSEYDFRWRMEQIQAAYGKGDIDHITRIGLKGKTLSPAHWEGIHEEIVEAQAGLMLCDPTYKMLGFRDENKAGDIAQVTAVFDRVTEATGASAAYAQHFSKGNQSQKESIDRGAGSGVWARDADAIITMTAHEEADCLSVETTLRSFPRIEPFVVRWSLPLFIRESQLDPAALKQPGASRAAIYSVSQLVDCLNGNDLSTQEFKILFMNETGASKGTFFKLLKTAEASKLIFKSKLGNKWERTSH